MEKSNRLMNFELLRIIAMLMIIILHTLSGSGILEEVDYANLNNVVAWLLEAISIVAVNIYVLISGYFLVDSEFKWKKVLKLWGEVFFYTFFLWILMKVTNLQEEISYKENFLSFFPILSKHYWFITTYFLMYMLLPYVNIIINSIDKKKYQVLLFILLIFFCFSTTFLPDGMMMDKTHGYGIIWFLFLYLVAGYIKRHMEKVFNKNIFLIMYILLTLLITSSKFFYNEVLKNITRNFYYYNSIPVFLSSLSLFLFFKEIKIERKNICNVIGVISPHTLAVYLIHCNVFLKENLWKKLLKVHLYINNKYFPFIVIGIVFCIFIICILIDIIRKRAFECFNDKIYKRSKIS